MHTRAGPCTAAGLICTPRPMLLPSVGVTGSGWAIFSMQKPGRPRPRGVRPGRFFAEPRPTCRPDPLHATNVSTNTHV